MAAERIRQGGLDRQAAAINRQGQDRFGDFVAKQGQSASDLGDYFTGQKIDSGAPLPSLPPSSSNITVREEARQRGKADAFGRQQGQALGELRAFGDVLGNLSRLQARDAGSIGQIGSFKAGSSGLVPFELENANSAGDGAKLFGDVLGLAGTVALGKGLSAGKQDPWEGLRQVGPIPKKSGLLGLFTR